MSRRNVSSRHRGFTLVELLVVISIIGLLVALLIPALSRARQSVRSVSCASNLRQLMQGMFYYVNDDGVFPGTHGLFYHQNFFSTSWPRPAGVTWDGARDRIVDLTVTPPYIKPYHLDPEFIADVPGKGTIYCYLKDEDVYKCSGDMPGEAVDTPIGGGGNGRISYSLNAYVGYKSPESLSGFTYVSDSPNNILPGGLEKRSFTAGQRINFPAAKFMTMFEEHPNSNINGGFPDGNFNGLDRIATRHMPASGTQGQSVSGRATIAYLDGHAENPIYPAKTMGRELFTEYGQPHYWRAEAPQDRDNAAAFVRRLPGTCPWGPP